MTRDQMKQVLDAPDVEPVAWAVQGCSRMWTGDFAEADAKAEAARCGGTCYAYPLYTAPQERKPLTKTKVGNFLRKHKDGDVSMYRNGFKDGVRFAEAAHGIGVTE